MNYEQKYKEALKRADSLTPKYGGRDLAEYIFPELAESEGERIRRTLVEYFGPKVQLDLVRGIPIQKIRDWLEKQKPAERSLEDNRIIGFVYALLNQIEWKDNWAMSKEECLRWLNNDSPQKPAEWSEEDEKMLRTIISDGSRGVELDSKQISWLKSLRPSWKPSEEQMAALNALNLHGDLSYVGQQNQLISLYQDLMKLL